MERPVNSNPQPPGSTSPESAQQRFWSDRIIEPKDPDNKLITHAYACIRRSRALLVRTAALVGKEAGRQALSEASPRRVR